MIFRLLLTCYKLNLQVFSIKKDFLCTLFLSLCQQIGQRLHFSCSIYNEKESQHKSQLYHYHHTKAQNMNTQIHSFQIGIKTHQFLLQFQKPQKSILVGDLNIAPGEEDVWDHKKLLKIVSHTPQEIQALNEVMLSANWVDIIRKDIPSGLLYSWWSYRARDWDTVNKGRRLDHIWATKDIADKGYGSYISRDVRGWEKPSDHAPVFASFDL